MNDRASLGTEGIPSYSYKELLESLGISVNKGSRAKKAAAAVHASALAQPAVQTGSRNTVLTSIAGSLRRQGLEEQQIEQILNTANDVIATDPLDVGEVSGIARSVSRYEPSDPGAVLATLTDIGNAERFARQWYASVRYVPEWKKWMVWNSQRWEPDDKQYVMELAKTAAREIHSEAAGVQSQDLQTIITKWAIATQKLERLKAMLKLAESIPELITELKELDKDRMLLGVANGVLDLRTGKLRAADPQDYMTRQAPVTFDAAAECPTFKSFLSSITAGRQDLMDYIRRIIGYGLTGETTEQCLFFFYGSGANGKSTLLNVIKELLGSDYCKQTPSETLMARAKGGGATSDVARLDGVRIALSNEVEEGSRLGESTVKQLTGSDPVAARFLYKEYFEFVPQFKVIIAGNHHPVIRGDDTGIWRRLQLVPFEVTIPLEERDQALPEKLRGELSGILNFAVEGCRNWQSSGLQPPQAVVAAVSEYKSEMDVLGQWIEENCAVSPAATISASIAYDDYRNWAIRNGFQIMNSNTFGRRLGKRHEKKKTRSGAFYLGLNIKPSGSPSP
jgi:putative DNA primase/helicase